MLSCGYLSPTGDEQTLQAMNQHTTDAFIPYGGRTNLIIRAINVENEIYPLRGTDKQVPWRQVILQPIYRSTLCEDDRVYNLTLCGNCESVKFIPLRGTDKQVPWRQVILQPIYRSALCGDDRVHNLALCGNCESVKFIPLRGTNKLLTSGSDIK